MKSKITKPIFLSLLLIVFMMFSLVGCDSAEDHIGETQPPSIPSLKGKLYDEVVKEFEDAGFINVQTNKLEDLVTGWMTKEGEVEKISVGGDESYDPDKWVSNDTEVLVTYHAFPEDENTSSNTDDNVFNKKENDLITPPYIQEEARYVDYKTVEEAFKNAGFINVTSKLKHMTAEQELKGTAKPGEVASISIGSSYVNDVTVQYSKDDAVYIEYYVLFSYDPLKELVSDTELSEYYAKTALEKHASSEYSHGIKFHWSTDLINIEQNNDGSWFVKVGVTITKSDGSKYDTVVEGTISGTDKNTEISQFHVNE